MSTIPKLKHLWIVLAVLVAVLVALVTVAYSLTGRATMASVPTEMDRPNVPSFEQMRQAIDRDDPDAVRGLLGLGYPVDKKDQLRDTALAIAVNEKQPNIYVVQALLDAGADPNAGCGSGWTPFLFSVRGPSRMVSALIDAKADVNSVTEDGITPLIAACMIPEPDLGVIDMLIRSGADIDAADANGETALDHARERANAAVSVLKAAHPRVQVSFKVLVRACLTNDAQRVKDLIAEGADVNEFDDDGVTPLMYAAIKTTDPKVIYALLNAKADANAQNTLGLTPLMYAAMNNKEPLIIRALIMGGHAKVNEFARGGITALDLARRHKNSRIITELIRDGAKDY